MYIINQEREFSTSSFNTLTMILVCNMIVLYGQML